MGRKRGGAAPDAERFPCTAPGCSKTFTRKGERESRPRARLPSLIPLFPDHLRRHSANHDPHRRKTCPECGKVLLLLPSSSPTRADLPNSLPLPLAGLRSTGRLDSSSSQARGGGRDRVKSGGALAFAGAFTRRASTRAAARARLPRFARLVRVHVRLRLLGRLGSNATRGFGHGLELVGHFGDACSPRL